MYNITISQFRSFFKDSPSAGIDDDFYIVDAKLSDRHQPLTYPCRFDCFMVIYCVNGSVKLNVNLDEYELKRGMIFINYPGNILKITELMDSKTTDLNYVCVMMSRSFVSNLMLDVNKLFTRNQLFAEHPCIEISEEHRQFLQRHVRLMISLIENDGVFKLECVRAVLASVFYFFAGVWIETLSSKDSESERVSSRSRALVDQFIKLVSEHHTIHRNVGFYAEKLCLTPKYLSRVIRDATGRSAPEWIDSYVILEAKNLLKYSGLAIKEIVYRLNFPNQSVFYKFFKARTGMTPSEYRNS
jgi:AraC-like DNA-binding protein